MAAGPEIGIYKGRIDGIVGDLGDLSTSLADFASILDTASEVVDFVDDTGEKAGQVRKAVDNQLKILDITKKAGPLSTPSKVFEQVLETVRPVAKTIEDKVDDLNNIGNNGTPPKEKGEFLEDLERGLSDASSALTFLAGKVSEAEALFADHAATVGDTFNAIEEATDAMRQTGLPGGSGEQWASRFADLNDAVNEQFGARNDAMDPLIQAYTDITGRIDSILDTMEKAKLDVAKLGAAELDAVTGFFEVISGPLEVAASILKPLQPLLDAAGFVFNLVVQPVFNFLTSTLGIDALIDEIRADIAAALPGADFLDDLFEQAEMMLDQLSDFNLDDFGIYTETNNGSGGVTKSGFLVNIEEAAFGDAVGNANNTNGSGPTAYGDANNNTIDLSGRTLVGGVAEGAVLDGKAGDDTLTGGIGNDLFIASEGNDVLDGGAGVDLVYFDGNFNEYELARDGESGPIIITHVKPPVGSKNQGSETITGFEYVVFNNIAFTGAELENAIIGGSVLNGTTDDDLMFLNSLGSTVGGFLGVGGFHVANGLGGDDRIFGSSANDQLNGGNGNDAFIPGQGDDEVNGDAGEDTYYILDNGNNSITTTINLLNGVANSGSSEGNDTVNSIENVVIQDGGETTITGANGANSLKSARGSDVLDGQGGNDILDAGVGDDFLIGGGGSDQLLGGAGNDALIAGSALLAGQSDYYDGGSGDGDTLGYSREGATYRDVDHTGANTAFFDAGALSSRLLDIATATGPVRIFAATGKIEHLDGAGNVIATDTAVGIENFVGSDSNDIIYGKFAGFPNTADIHGADGDDILYSEGATRTFGGNGDDQIFATLAEGDANVTYNFDGGSGFDTLDLQPVGDVRWQLRIAPGGVEKVRAYDTSVTSSIENSASAGKVYVANFKRFEEYILGNNDDYVLYNEEGTTILGVFQAGAGNDLLVSNGGRAVFHAGDGEDVGEISGAAGEFYGGTGRDRVSFDAISGADSIIEMGADEDYVLLDRFRGTADGGSGFDTLAFAPGHEGVSVDLANGTATAPSNSIDATISGFERLLGTEFGDNPLSGSANDDEIAGLGGTDLVRGQEGNDDLYGGDASDTLEGGDGDDLLHGGRHNDTLRGGAGNDTASYATAHLGDIDGNLAAIFGGVTVDLGAGTSSGAHGNDTLVGIENVFGSISDDTLIGDEVKNVLSGGRGNDTLRGLAGNDTFLLDGDDIAFGGSGDDEFYAGAGNLTLFGDAGVDALNFSSLTGSVDINLQLETFATTASVDAPVWFDTGTTELRGGLSPQDVLETDILFANDAADLTRVVPNAQIYDIKLEAEQQFAGTARSFETIIGSNFADTITGSLENNSLIGGEGNDILVGVNEGDTVDLSNTISSQVYRIYRATLDRAPDTGGFEFWVGQLESGNRSLQSVATGFVVSAEFQNVYGNLTDTEFVTLLYDNVLDRAPDTGGLNAWVGHLSNGGTRESVVTGFSESEEFKGNTSVEANAYSDALPGRAQSMVMDDVFRLYQATLDRAPDEAGHNSWASQLASGREYLEVVSGFTNSTEFRNTYGNLGDTAFINQLYRNVLDREADAGGLAGWQAVIDGGGTRADVVRGFAQSTEFIGNTAAPFEAYMKDSGGDRLDGGAGSDTLYGGLTADTFVFDANEDGTDKVLQLDTWDTLQFDGFGYGAAADALAKMAVSGSDVRFNDQGVGIVFAGADFAALQEVDYVFG